MKAVPVLFIVVILLAGVLGELVAGVLQASRGRRHN
jgi:hypothetical protein